MKNQPMCLARVLLVVLTSNLCLVGAAQAHTTPIKVFVLAGQSNMVGMGSLEHLSLLVHDNTTCCNPYRRDLWNGTHFKVSSKPASQQYITFSLLPVVKQLTLNLLDSVSIYLSIYLVRRSNVMMYSSSLTIAQVLSRWDTARTLNVLDPSSCLDGYSAIIFIRRLRQHQKNPFT